MRHSPVLCIFFQNKVSTCHLSRWNSHVYRLSITSGAKPNYKKDLRILLESVFLQVATKRQIVINEGG